MSALARIRSFLRGDGGFVFLAPVVVGLFFGGALVAGETIYEADKNASMVERANEDLTEQMNYIIEQTDGAKYGRAKDTNEKARRLREIARDIKIETAENYLETVVWETGKVGVDVGTKLVGGPIDVANDVLQGVGVLNDTIGLATVDAEGRGETAAYIKRLNDVRFQATERELAKGEPLVVVPYNPGSAAEVAIVETKLDITQRMVQATVPDVKPEGARDLAEEILLDSEPVAVELPEAAEALKEQGVTLENYLKVAEAIRTKDLVGPPDKDMTGEEFVAAREQALGPLAEALTKSVAKVDPDLAKGKEGEIVLTEEDEQALKDGTRASAVGVFMSPMGPQPIVVTGNDKGRFVGDFPTLKAAPDLTMGEDLTVPKKQWQSWWDGTRKSCPFLYASDGTRDVPVNDIISVSRDPEREYVDRMLFAAEPRADGTLELSIREVRSEESFIDLVAFSAVDVPNGYSVGLSPDGAAYSVGAAAPPLTTGGASAASLSVADGEGAAAYDGDAVTATFEAPGPGAVLLMTADGFEDDGTPKRVVPKRPALTVEAFADGRWHPVGEAHPRERADTTAFDMARFVRGGRVTVRVAALSCDSSRYQLIDRLALSSAPSGLARVRPLTGRVAGTVPGANALLAVRDGRRAHLTPGQRVTFAIPSASADAYIIESVGWYRELRGGM